MFNSHELSRRNRGSRSHALSFLFSQTHLLKSFIEVTLPFMLHLWRGKLLKLQWVHGKPHVERQGFSLCGFGTFSHQAIWDKCGFNIAFSKTIVSISMKKKIYPFFSGLRSCSSLWKTMVQVAWLNLKTFQNHRVVPNPMLYWLCHDYFILGDLTLFVHYIWIFPSSYQSHVGTRW